LTEFFFPFLEIGLYFCEVKPILIFKDIGWVVFLDSSFGWGIFNVHLLQFHDILAWIIDTKMLFFFNFLLE
jgi:hypothetical protein